MTRGTFLESACVVPSVPDDEELWVGPQIVVSSFSKSYRVVGVHKGQVETRTKVVKVSGRWVLRAQSKSLNALAWGDDCADIQRLIEHHHPTNVGRSSDPRPYQAMLLPAEKMRKDVGLYYSVGGEEKLRSAEISSRERRFDSCSCRWMRKMQ